MTDTMILVMGIALIITMIATTIINVLMVFDINNVSPLKKRKKDTSSRD